MNEDSGVKESSQHVAYLDLGFSNGKVEAKVVASADGIQEAVELAKAVCDQWLGLTNGENDIAKIAEVGPVVVSKKVAMPEHEEASAVGVPTDGDPNVPPAALALIQRMPLEDLKSISSVVMNELARRRGSEDGDAEASNLGEIHGEVAGAEAPASPSTGGDAVTDN